MLSLILFSLCLLVVAATASKQDNAAPFRQTPQSLMREESATNNRHLAQILSPNASTIIHRGGHESGGGGSAVVQVMETEVYDMDTGTWKGANPHRWTKIAESGQLISNGKSPTEISPPRGMEFDGDWKIVTSTVRDSLGWEYHWEQQQQQSAPQQQQQVMAIPIRRRIWLRSLKPITTIIPTPPAVSTTTKTVSKKKRKKRRKIQFPQLFNFLYEHFNFKGFGLSLFKSLIFPSSVGLSFRVPLVTNFDWWDRHPALPIVSAASAVFFPWTAIQYLSASLDVNFLTWAIGRMLKMTTLAMLIMIKTLIHVICLPISLFITIQARLQQKQQQQQDDYDANDDSSDEKQKFILFPSLPPIPPMLATSNNPTPTYSLTTQQRIGMSLSWRLSQRRGYEFRVTYWYMYLPTIMHLLDLFWRHKRDVLPSRLTNWLRRKTGSLGFSFATPIPDPPHSTCSLFMSLSGFYLKDDKTSSSVSSSSSSVDTILNDKNEKEEQQLLNDSPNSGTVKTKIKVGSHDSMLEQQSDDDSSSDEEEEEQRRIPKRTR